MKGESLADELVNDGDDATLGGRTRVPRVRTSSLRMDLCQVQGADKGLNINWVCTVSRRLALTRSSRRETTNEYVASSLAITRAAPASVLEFVAPSPAVAYQR